MQEVKFIEDESIKENCKMAFTFSFTGEDYKAREGYKNDIKIVQKMEAYISASAS